MTSATALILVHLLPGTSSDKAIDALYAFTDCEVSISPNCCVISDKKHVIETVVYFSNTFFMSGYYAVGLIAVKLQDALHPYLHKLKQVIAGDFAPKRAK